MAPFELLYSSHSIPLLVFPPSLVCSHWALLQCFVSTEIWFCLCVVFMSSLSFASLHSHSMPKATIVLKSIRSDQEATLLFNVLTARYMRIGLILFGYIIKI